MRHKFSGILRIKTDHQVLARRPDIVIINKKKEILPNSRLCHPSRPPSKNQRKLKESQLLGPCQKTKKKQTMEHEGDNDTNYNWYARNYPKDLIEGMVE